MKRIPYLIFVLFFIMFGYSCNGHEDEKEARQVIHQFGKQLKQVSVLAPDSLLISQMKRVYKPYVTQELLQSWITQPSTAPGKETSSPWPQKIDIVQITKVKDGQFRAEGEVVYITSIEKVNGGKAMIKKVVIEVKKTDKGLWKICQYSIGL